MERKRTADEQKEAQESRKGNEELRKSDVQCRCDNDKEATVVK
jgi:hypothetical protein